MKKYIPIKSLRTFQRYMGKAVEFQINSKHNMQARGDTYSTPSGDWLYIDPVHARRLSVRPSDRLALRAVIEVPEPEGASA